MPDDWEPPVAKATGEPCKRCEDRGAPCCNAHGAQGKDHGGGVYKFDDVKKKQYLEFLTNGMGRTQASSAVGIHRSTLANHRNADPEFAKQESEAEMTAAGRVENALFEKAIQGHPTAQIFFLKNRLPDRWRDMQVHEVVDRVKEQERDWLFGLLDSMDLTDEQRAKLEAAREAGTVH